MSDRGMKKWAAYKALIEQEPKNLQMEINRTKCDKPILSEESQESINEILTNYNGEELIVTIYKNGFITEKNIVIKKIDPYERKLILKDCSIISLDSIVGLKIAEKNEEIY